MKGFKISTVIISMRAGNAAVKMIGAIRYFMINEHGF